MTNKDLLLKALAFTMSNFDGEVASIMLNDDEVSDAQINLLEEELSRLYQRLDDQELVIMKVTRFDDE